MRRLTLSSPRCVQTRNDGIIDFIRYMQFDSKYLELRSNRQCSSTLPLHAPVYTTSTTTITVVEKGQTALALANIYVISRRVECCESAMNTACVKTPPTTSQPSNPELSQTWSKSNNPDATDSYFIQGARSQANLHATTPDAIPFSSNYLTSERL